MSHQESYSNNQAYAEFLSTWEDGFYAKYTDALAAAKPGARVLDVGCGVGQVVKLLSAKGYEAHGVDVSRPNIERAQKVSPRCQLYDGKQLPFPDASFAGAGSFNVLEHVDAPEDFIAEIVRVVEPGGTVVISSPNFLRAAGFRDYHPRMRGLGNKWRNFWLLMAKRRQMREHPETVRFERMPPIVKTPFTPDDDAVVATNGLEMAFFLERNGCRIESVSCTDRYVAKPVDILLNLTPMRFLMFNAFVRARKSENVASPKNKRDF